MAQQRYEAPDIGAMIGRMLRALGRRAAGGDIEAVAELAKLSRYAGTALGIGARAAHDHGGYSWTDIGEATAMSRQAARQRFGTAPELLPPPPTPPATDVAPDETEAPAEGDTEPATVPAIPDTIALTSTRASRQERAHYGRRPVMFYDTRNGRGVIADTGEAVETTTEHPSLVGTVPDVLGMAHTARGGHTSRNVVVYLVGPIGDQHRPAGDRVREWALSTPLAGWRVADRGHYLADADAPVCRWTDGQLTVEVHHAGSWFGDTEASAGELADVWRRLGIAVDRAFPGGRLMATPSTTGRDLWLRTIGPKQEWPVLAPELAELVHATAGQGRIELRGAPEAEGIAPAFTYLDGRFMYAGLTWGLPVGKPRLWSSRELAGLTDAEADALLHGRGRWHVRARVPADWQHVGLLMAPAAGAMNRPAVGPMPVGGGWHYPSAPRELVECWADGAEVLLARNHGWRVELVEGMTWREGKPLNVWRDRLLGIWQQANAAGVPLAAAAVRRMLLFGIGAFASRSHPSTHAVHVDQADASTGAGALDGVRHVGDMLVWQTPAQLGEWAANMAHPEWAAAVWARARVRLLDAPAGAGYGRVGALHVPGSAVIGFRTDALYLTHDPQWPDDGEVGRFRCKGRITEPRPWPATVAELLALRDESEAGA